MRRGAVVAIFTVLFASVVMAAGAQAAQRGKPGPRGPRGFVGAIGPIGPQGPAGPAGPLGSARPRRSAGPPRLNRPSGSCRPRRQQRQAVPVQGRRQHRHRPTVDTFDGVKLLASCNGLGRVSLNAVALNVAPDILTERDGTNFQIVPRFGVANTTAAILLTPFSSASSRADVTVHYVSNSGANTTINAAAVDLADGPNGL